ncbi:MAG: hypothetical protein WBM86_21120, partial [Waterburya sp.]
IASSLVVAKPAAAFDLKGLFTGVTDGMSLDLGEVLQQLGISNKYIDIFLEDMLGIHSEETAQQIEEDLECPDCALQIPDLNQAEANIGQTLEKTGQLEKLEKTKNLIQAGVVRSHADSILGAEGQQKIVDTSKDIGESIARSSQYAQNAQSRKVTQDVIKDLTLQMSEINYVMGQNQQSIDKLNVSTAYNNRVNAELLEKAAAEQQRIKQENTNNLVAEITIISAFSDLFGGE